MKSSRILINLAYVLTIIFWPVAVLIGLVTFVTGGFFVWVAYWCLWDFIRDLKEDHQALERTRDDEASVTEQVTKEVDWALARTRDAHPATVILHHNGTQDLGDINGPQSLGYPVHRADVRFAYPTQVQCQDCSARFEPPYPRVCEFCGSRKFAVPSMP